MALFDLLSAAADAAPLAYGTSPGIPWLRIALSFLFCIALAVAAIGVIRARNGLPVLPDRSRFGEALGKQEGGSAAIRIVERLNVTPTSQIVLLGKGSQSYLLYLSGDGATVIDRFSEDGDQVR